MEYIICIIIMLVWAMIFYCWGYWNGSRDAYKHMFRKWVEFKENKALKDRIDILNNQHIKIQYHGEELTIREICERLDDLQNKVNKYECEIRKYTESCDDCNFCKMED